MLDMLVAPTSLWWLTVPTGRYIRAPWRSESIVTLSGDPERLGVAASNALFVRLRPCKRYDYNCAHQGYQHSRKLSRFFHSRCVVTTELVGLQLSFKAAQAPLFSQYCRNVIKNGVTLRHPPRRVNTGDPVRIVYVSLVEFQGSGFTYNTLGVHHRCAQVPTVHRFQEIPSAHRCS